jgi:transposase
MALLMVMAVCLLVYTALEYRIRTVMKEHGATFPDPKGHRSPHPTTRWVFHYFVGIPVLYIPRQGLMILHLTDEHWHLLQLLGEAVCLVVSIKMYPNRASRCGMSDFASTLAYLRI